MPTHGSLTKAGKVRAQTPKIEGTPKTHAAPMKRNRSNYSKRVLHASDSFDRRRSERY